MPANNRFNRQQIANRIKPIKETGLQNDKRIARELQVLQLMGFAPKELILLDADHIYVKDMIVPMRFIEKD